jgi:hypothetical protein
MHNNGLPEAMCSKQNVYKLSTNIRCLKVHHLARVLFSSDKPGSKLTSVSLAKMHRLCLFWLGTEKQGTCLRNFHFTVAKKG